MTGEAITTAARIQSLARPGEILLDEATVRGGRDRLVVDDRGSVVLRGQSSVVQLLRADRRASGSDWPRRRGSAADGPARRAAATRRRVIRKVAAAGQAIGARRGRARDRRRGDGQVAPGRRARARGAGDSGFAWTWTESVSYGRGEPYRFARALRPGRRRRARHRLRQLRPAAAVRTRTRIRRRSGATAARSRPSPATRRSPAGRRRRRTCPTTRPRRPPILGEVGIAYIERLLDHRRTARRRPRRRPLDRHLERRDGRAHRRDGRRTRRWSSSPRCGPGPRPPGPTLPHVDADRRSRAGRRRRRPSSRRSSPGPRSMPTTPGGSTSGPQGNPLFIGETVRASIEDGTLELRDGRMTLVESRPAAAAADAAGRPRARASTASTSRRATCSASRRSSASASATAMSRTCSSGRSRPAHARPAGRRRARSCPLDDGTWRFSHPLVHDAAYAGLLAIAAPPAPRAAGGLGSRPGPRPTSVAGARRPSGGLRRRGAGDPAARSRRRRRRWRWVPRPRRPGSGGRPPTSRRTRPMRHGSARPPVRRCRPPRRPTGLGSAPAARSRRPPPAAARRSGQAGDGGSDPRAGRLAQGLELGATGRGRSGRSAPPAPRRGAPGRSPRRPSGGRAGSSSAVVRRAASTSRRSAPRANVDRRLGRTGVARVHEARAVGRLDRRRAQAGT